MAKYKPVQLPDRPPLYADVVFATVPLDKGGSMQLKLDIYQQPGQTQPGPCIVYLFGGGFMYGDYKQTTNRAVYFRDLVKLVDEGYTIVSPAYRLSGEAALPACVHDCKGAIRFLKANAGKYHIDPGRIGVLGNSAGGCLAAMVAMSATTHEMEGDVGGNLEYDSSVKAAVAYYTPAKLLTPNENKSGDIGEGKNIKNMDEEGPMALALGFTGPGKGTGLLVQLEEKGDTTDPNWKYVELAYSCSPITYATKPCPPIMLLHGVQDPVVPIQQSELLYRALAAAGNEAYYVSYSLAGHGPSMGTEGDQMAYRFLTGRLEA